MPLWELLASANVQWVAAGTFLLGASSGVLGTFTLLRRRSLMADVLSHAALPGIAAAFMLTQTKSVEPLLLGAVAAGLAGTWCVDVITRHSRIKEDTAQGLVLAVFFGLGVVLLTRIAASGAAGQSGLDRFLFGQAASLVGRDLRIIGAIAVLLTAAVVLLFKEFKLLCFDPNFGRGIGFPMALVDRVLMLLVVCAVAVGLQAVGVVLMAAMMITPAAAARYWTNRLEVMVLLAGLFGGAAGIAGTLISLGGVRLATGPLIVLAAAAIFVFSLAFGPKGGLVLKARQQARVRRKVAVENVLRYLYERHEVRQRQGEAGGAQQPSPGGAPTGAGRGYAPVPLGDIAQLLGWKERRAKRLVQAMEREGLLAVAAPGGGKVDCFLTAEGEAQARQVVRKHRLWEMFLAYEADFAIDHVDRDADDIEHYLPAEVVRELERRMGIEDEAGAFPESVHPLDHGT